MFVLSFSCGLILKLVLTELDCGLQTQHIWKWLSSEAAYIWVNKVGKNEQNWKSFQWIQNHLQLLTNRKLVNSLYFYKRNNIKFTFVKYRNCYITNYFFCYTFYVYGYNPPKRISRMPIRSLTQIRFSLISVEISTWSRRRDVFLYAYIWSW